MKKITILAAVGVAFALSACGVDEQAVPSVSTTKTSSTATAFDAKAAQAATDRARQARRKAAAQRLVARMMNRNDRMTDLATDVTRQAANVDVNGVCSTVAQIETLMGAQDRDMDRLNNSTIAEKQPATIAKINDVFDAQRTSLAAMLSASDALC